MLVVRGRPKSRHPGGLSAVHPRYSNQNRTIKRCSPGLWGGLTCNCMQPAGAHHSVHSTRSQTLRKYTSRRSFAPSHRQFGRHCPRAPQPSLIHNRQLELRDTCDLNSSGPLTQFSVAVLPLNPSSWQHHTVRARMRRSKVKIVVSTSFAAGILSTFCPCGAPESPSTPPLANS